MKPDAAKFANLYNHEVCREKTRKLKGKTRNVVTKELFGKALIEGAVCANKYDTTNVTLAQVSESRGINRSIRIKRCFHISLRWPHCAHQGRSHSLHITKAILNPNSTPSIIIIMTMMTNPNA